MVKRKKKKKIKRQHWSSRYTFSIIAKEFFIVCYSQIKVFIVCEGHNCHLKKAAFLWGGLKGQNCNLISKLCTTQFKSSKVMDNMITFLKILMQDKSKYVLLKQILYCYIIMETHDSRTKCNLIIDKVYFLCHYNNASVTTKIDLVRAEGRSKKGETRLEIDIN